MPKQNKRIKLSYVPFPTKALWNEKGQMDMAIFDPKNFRETFWRLVA